MQCRGVEMQRRQETWSRVGSSASTLLYSPRDGVVGQVSSVFGGGGLLMNRDPVTKDAMHDVKTGPVFGGRSCE
jgi:hypothetical protein